MTAKKNIDPRIFDLYDEYCHVVSTGVNFYNVRQ